MLSDAGLWIAFWVIAGTALFLDNFVFHKKAQTVSLRAALGWSAAYIFLAFLYGMLVWKVRGLHGFQPEVGRFKDGALSFFAAYLVEESLSVDNLFVFLVIFKAFGIKPSFQHRVLFWGILGAVVLRFLFISAGIALVSRFGWLMYVFGAFLIWTGFKLVLSHGKATNPGESPVIRAVGRLFPLAKNYIGEAFFIRHKGAWAMTTLFLALVAVESSDVAFAVDSIPAVLAISQDKLIVYTSNIFAILGLRNLYFALAGIMPLFRFLSHGLAVILVFIGFKMIAAHHGSQFDPPRYHLPTPVALGVLALILVSCVAASLAFPAKKKRRHG